jgi:hypothetical protein
VSEETIRVAGIPLITVPTIAFGGARLLRAIYRREEGFFLSTASPEVEKPNPLMVLVPVGGVLLSAGALVLGIGLVAA